VVPLKRRKIPQVRSTDFRGIVYGTIAQVERIHIFDVAVGLASSAEDVFCEGIMRIWVANRVWEEASSGDFHHL
jgi:hypothetical protein